MRVFLAGATGAIGRALVPRLLEAGHEVVGTTRSPERAAALEAAGAEPAVLDALDAGAVREALARARPDAVVNQLTELPSTYDAPSMRRAAGPTTRLRSEGHAILLDAARAAGARRYLVQSVAFYAAPGPGLASEEEPLVADAPEPVAQSVRTIAELEATTLAAAELEPVVLRYGYLYGPGTWYAPDGSVADQLRRRRMPIVGSGGSVYSFVHVDDAAEATVRALAGPPGVYHLVDDEPIVLRDLLRAYAQTLGAPAPRRIPRFVARMVAGAGAVYLLERLRGASNAKARRELDWRPRPLELVSGEAAAR